MPAKRSRTERWKDCLHQIADRRGAIELSLKPASDADARSPHLIWRVGVLGASETEIRVEQPSVVGQPIPLDDDQPFVGVMAIGQNRWMFHTRLLGRVAVAQRSGARTEILRLSMPEGVERCQRRNFYRVSTAELRLPSVECWPLLDPTSVVGAQAACLAQACVSPGLRLADENAEEDASVLPEVGPKFHAHLMNLGGGGAGLLADPENARGLEGQRSLWLRIDLRPSMPTPLSVAVKVCHTRLDSAHNVYAGVAFDFTFSGEYQRFVIDRVCRFIDDARQAARRAA